MLLAIGLMSGTSMDGVDAALIKTDGEFYIEELGNAVIDYPSSAKILFKAAEYAVKCFKGNLKQAEENYLACLKYFLKENLGLNNSKDLEARLLELESYLISLNFSLNFSSVIKLSTSFHAQAVQKLLEKFKNLKIDLIGYHGQTVFHDPAHQLSIQLGDGEKLAKDTGIPVINDFRTQDILAGGQGAPFAPIYHQALIARDSLKKQIKLPIKLPVIVLNCGGIANLSLIQDLNPENLIGFDTGPGNGLIDRFVKLKTAGQWSMDLDGCFGKKGKVDQKVLEKLIKTNQDYFNLTPPKSLDINDMTLIPEVLALSLNNGCATLEALTAIGIMEGLKFLPELGCPDIPKIWVLAGGGWNNPVITQELKNRLEEKLGAGQFVLKTADQLGWNNKALEAQLFAYLAVRSFEKKPLSFPGVTGVSRPMTGGVLHQVNQADKNLALDIEALIHAHQNASEPPESLLTTESPHGLTQNLSDLAKTNLTSAYQALIQVDQLFLEKLENYKTQILALSDCFSKVLKAGDKIYFSGCGSAARAALVARKIVSEAYPDYKNQIRTIAAGGELVVIRAAEGFEDRADYGCRQLEQAGWTPNDLLVGISASGAAGFVSGQIKFVLEKEVKYAPVFFACNEFETLEKRFVKDEKTIFFKGWAREYKNQDKIKFLTLDIGEMGLSGSTRMQAATAQLLVLGWSLLRALGDFLNFSECLNQLKNFLKTVNLNISNLVKLTQFEITVNQEKPKSGLLIYKTTADYGLTIATDLTERAPTFSWNYFEHDQELDKNFKKFKQYSACRLVIAGEQESKSALFKLLGRAPEVLNWPQEQKTSLEYLLGYDLTENIINKRKACEPDLQVSELLFEIKNGILKISNGHKILLELEMACFFKNNLLIQLGLKIILNMHSTLLAGALGFYEGNSMLFVRPSNQKLMNRALEFALKLVKQSLGEDFSREDLIPYFYQAMRTLGSGESVVFKTRDLVLAGVYKNFDRKSP